MSSIKAEENRLLIVGFTNFIKYSITTSANASQPKTIQLSLSGHFTCITTRDDKRITLKIVTPLSNDATMYSQKATLRFTWTSQIFVGLKDYPNSLLFQRVLNEEHENSLFRNISTFTEPLSVLYTQCSEWRYWKIKC